MGNKIKITEKQFDTVVGEILSESVILSEAQELTRGDVDSIATKAIKTFLSGSRSPALESNIKIVVRDMMKSDKETTDKIVEVAKNVIIQLYKALWTKRSFWISDLKNSNS
jgi:hypothetical protein